MEIALAPPTTALAAPVPEVVSPEIVGLTAPLLLEPNWNTPLLVPLPRVTWPLAARLPPARITVPFWTLVEM